MFAAAPPLNLINFGEKGDSRCKCYRLKLSIISGNLNKNIIIDDYGIKDVGFGWSILCCC